MGLVEDTNVRHRLHLPVVVAIVLTTLATAMAGASAQSPAGAPSQASMRGASSAARPSPRVQFPGFLLDRGRYTAFEVAGAVTQTFPLGINDRGQIVGYYDDAARTARLPAAEGRQAQHRSTSRAPAQPRP